MLFNDTGGIITFISIVHHQITTVNLCFMNSIFLFVFVQYFLCFKQKGMSRSILSMDVFRTSV